MSDHQSETTIGILIEWNRRSAAACRSSGLDAGAQSHDETADALLRLNREVDMWRGENAKKQLACEQMGARIAKLEAALKSADAAMAYAQWGASHPARMAVGKALGEQRIDRICKMNVL